MLKCWFSGHFEKLKTFSTFLDGFQTQTNSDIALSNSLFISAMFKPLFDDVEKFAFKQKIRTLSCTVHVRLRGISKSFNYYCGLYFWKISAAPLDFVQFLQFITLNKSFLSRIQSIAIILRSSSHCIHMFNLMNTKFLPTIPTLNFTCMELKWYNSRQTSLAHRIVPAVTQPNIGIVPITTITYTNIHVHPRVH